MAKNSNPMQPPAPPPTAWEPGQYANVPYWGRRDVDADAPEWRFILFPDGRSAAREHLRIEGGTVYVREPRQHWEATRDDELAAELQALSDRLRAECEAAMARWRPQGGLKVAAAESLAALLAYGTEGTGCDMDLTRCIPSSDGDWVEDPPNEWSASRDGCRFYATEAGLIADRKRLHPQLAGRRTQRRRAAP